MTINLNNLINLRGNREQFHLMFCHGFKGGMKNITTTGCRIRTPLSYAFGSHDIQNELLYERIRIGEESPMLKAADLIDSTVFVK